MNWWRRMMGEPARPAGGATSLSWTDWVRSHPDAAHWLLYAVLALLVLLASTQYLRG
jgi:hypothetical protein